MLERFRGTWATIMAPLARVLSRLGVSPDVITVVGTLGVIVGAMAYYPRGLLWQGTAIVVLFVFADMVDGQMARDLGRASAWGAFLDSTLDRLGDGAIFGGVVLYFAYGYQVADRLVAFDAPMVWGVMAGIALVMGQLTSYVKARAESLGFEVTGGLAARADRLVLVLLAALLAGLGVPYALEAAVSLLAVLSTVTVLQRIAIVHQQAHPVVGQRPEGDR